MTARNKSIALRVSETIRCARRKGSVYPIAATIATGLVFGLPAAAFTVSQLSAAQSSGPNRALSALEGVTAPSSIKVRPVSARPVKRADFKRELASEEARQVADWVVDSRDNRSLPFVIVDKMNAKVFVFHADGRLRGAAPALLGSAKGDSAVPGIGDRKLSSIRPEERTTPAGRFVAALGRNLQGIEILWVDYDGAVSMHRVITTRHQEHRLERLATPTPLDNRISFGCINVPVKFYNNVVHPAFTGTNGIVYVLPETISAREVFGSYDVEEHAQQKSREIHPKPPSNKAGAKKFPPLIKGD